MKNLIQPKGLKPGDTIGFAAPAGIFDAKRFVDGLSVFHEMGYKTVVPAELFNISGNFTGTARERADRLHNLFRSPDIRAIVCVRGGFGALKILPYLDWEVIGTHPKIFVGFSDITALLVSLYQRSGQVVFHGPTAISLPRADEETIHRFFGAMNNRLPDRILPNHPIILKRGRGSGRLIGGNLTTLCHMLGTPYFPKLDGHVLFLEDCNEAPYRIDRMLTQMRLANALKGLKGLVLGCFSGCGNMDDVYNVIGDAFKVYEIPIMGGFDIGHKKANLTLPIGIRVTLDTKKNTQTGGLEFEPFN